MKCERMNALARWILTTAENGSWTHATQWLERTLDDSANRRLVITEAFLATDAVLNLLVDVVSGLVVHPPVIAANMRDELPFMATENILMRGTAAGHSRQDLHERVRQHSLAAVARMKLGEPNDLLERMREDAVLGPFVDGDVAAADRFVGRAPEQVDEFLVEQLRPLLARHAHRSGRFAARVHV